MTSNKSHLPVCSPPGDTPLFRSAARRDWLWAGLLVAATLLVYHQVWHAGFIWDDDAHLTKNPCIVGPLGFAGIWTTSAATYYPLTLTTFWLQHALWGLNPAPYHVVNVLMHAASAVLLWRVLRALEIPGAWLAAGVWALHPVQVESVAWITELKNTQSCFFFLLAILLFLRWHDGRQATGRRREGAYAAALFAAALAILSKSSTVMLPVILALCWWWRERTWRWANLTRLLPFLILSLTASAWTIWEQQYHSGALGAEWNQTLAERAVISGKVIWFYLGKLIWPHPLIFIYPRWEIDASRLPAYFPTLAAVLALGALWWWRQRGTGPAFFAMAYFVASLLPVMGFFNVYFFRYSFVGDHLQYLASIGPLALVAASLTVTLNSLGARRRFLLPVAGGLLLLVLGFLSARQSVIYANEEKLWQATAAQNPRAWIAHNNLGRLDRVEEAVGHYRRAIELNPFFAEGHNNLATALMRTGHVDEALGHFRRAIELDPLYADAFYNFGNALLQLGRLDDAIPLYRRGLALQPDDAEAQYNLGVALLGTGRGDLSVAHLQKALELEPTNQDAAQNLAWILATQPNPAVRDGARAVQLAEHLTGRTAHAQAVLAAAYAEAGRFPDAIRAAEEGLRTARAAGDQDLSNLLSAQLAAFRENTPWRDKNQRME